MGRVPDGSPPAIPTDIRPAMDGKLHIKRRSRRVALGMLAAIALPAGAGGPALAEEKAIETPAFASQFKSYSALPGKIEPAAHIVDMSEFEPPVEQVPAMRSLGKGVASYYGKRFNGRPTASGERFDMNQLTAAHRTLPFGSMVQVTNPANGRSVTVRINDRGPFHGRRVIDLSRSAAEVIGIIRRGHGTVELALVE